MFDFIVAGGGSAGCVLAARLSEDPGAEVLLLEAGGPDQRLEIHIPADFPKLFRSEVDWNQSTAPQVDCVYRRMYWPLGKVLGGSGSMNSMLYVRGNPEDYDHWENLGNREWGWQKVEPWFLKSENNTAWNNQHHGRNGPLQISDQRHPHVLSQAFVQAAESLGFRHNPDFNGESQQGFGFFQVLQKRGRRYGTAQAFLKPARRRRNLKVLTQATVLRVVLEGDRAAAVEYVRNGRLERARCSGEVVLSAGTICTPHILFHSGIGPAENLEAFGIRPQHALPGVGLNLQDHAVAAVISVCKDPIAFPANPPRSWLWKWLAFGRGPLTSPIAEAGGFVTLNGGNGTPPDIHFQFAPCEFRNHGFYTEGLPMYTIGVTVLRPKSVGRLSLRSNRPQDMPSIDARYFTSGNDLQMMIEGLALARKMARAGPLERYRKNEFLPGEEAEDPQELQQYVRRECQTLYHPVGTCRMGTDKLAVVDDRLRVHGIRGLRVADASVMPTIPRGDTNAPTIMIAERAAHWMLGGY